MADEAAMTPERFRACLEALDWPLSYLAQRLGMSSDRVLRRWQNGQNPIPDDVGRWLEALAAAHEANPAPARPVVAAGIFRDHHCPVCQDGRVPCREGDPWRCGNPIARND